jgi:hypothetical protein
VSATEGESVLTEQAQRQGVWALTGGPGRQGARARSGTRGPSVRSESDGGDQTRGDERLRVALTGGPGR